MEQIKKPKYPYVLQSFKLYSHQDFAKASHEEIINSLAEEQSFLARYNKDGYKIKERPLNRNELKALPIHKRLIASIPAWVYYLVSIGLGYLLGKLT
jgi:hypothetical protein